MERQIDRPVRGIVKGTLRDETAQGVVEFAGAFVALAHAHAVGRPERDTKRWDPDEYEARLKEARR